MEKEELPLGKAKKRSQKDYQFWFEIVTGLTH
jgi:hypothetical protein